MKGATNMTLAVTKTIQIQRSVADTYAFVSDPNTMPLWAIHNVKAIRRLDEQRWEMDTPHGKAILVPHYEKTNAIVDHEYIDANDGRWSVSARVVAVGPTESIYIITLAKPEAMPVEAFHMGMKLMDDELEALKANVEAR
jgi:hypothetical protein